jgi:hypothetical protein
MGSGNANEMWHQQKKVPTLRVQPLGRYGVRQTGCQEQKPVEVFRDTKNRKAHRAIGARP